MISINQLTNIITGEMSEAQIDKLTSRIMTTKTNGIEGLPYQFPSSVDPRISGTEIGRKYAEKIFARLPLLFLTPVEPLFMDEFKKDDKDLVMNAVYGLVKGTDVGSFLSGSTGRYYTTEFAYTDYYKYLNLMLQCVAKFMGIQDEYLPIANPLGGGETQIKNIQWEWELNDDFKTFFSGRENLVFYLDSFDSISESISNDTTESSIASQINGFGDQMNEIRFLFGKEGNAVSNVINQAGDVTTAITDSAMGSGLISSIGGGIVSALSNKGVNSIMNGGKIIFPEIWNNSDYSRSYNLEIKLRSPDNDPLSIYLNILKPYCKLLTLTLPRQLYDDRGNMLDYNSYGAPFMVRAYSKGMFNVDMGMISSMTVNKGGTAQWNDDGLPTQLDISIEVKDLYSRFAMSKLDTLSTNILSVVNNTAYMDYLANMAGLNIGQMEMGRRIRMAYYLSTTSLNRMESGIFTKVDNSITRLFGRMYNTV